MMKKTKILILLVIFLCTATISFTETNNPTAVDSIKDQAQAGTPKAVVAQKAFSFSEVLEGETVTHAFLIENQGTAPLKVLDVRTGCGCTTAQRPEIIAPGAQDRIVVKANTNGYGGRVFDRAITVFTNDPVQPRIQLQLSGSVIQFARVEPRHIVLSGRRDETLQAKATITPNQKYPFHITSTHIDKPLAKMIDVQTQQRDGIYYITVSNRKSAPGKYRGSIIFKTDSATRPTLTLFARGHILE